MYISYQWTMAFTMEVNRDTTFFLPSPFSKPHPYMVSGTQMFFKDKVQQLDSALSNN